MPNDVLGHAGPMSSEEGSPQARPVDAAAVIERPTPWLPARTVLLNLVLIFVGGGLFWFLIDRIQAPLWVAFIAYAVIFTLGSLAMRLTRNARGDRIHE